MQNSFEIVESHLIEIRSSGYRFYSYDQEKHYTGFFTNGYSRLVNCFLVRKEKAVKKIVNPTQYYYDQLEKDENKVEEDFNSSVFDKIVLFTRNFVPMRFHGMFFNLYLRLKIMLSRNKYFDIKYK